MEQGEGHIAEGLRTGQASAWNAFFRAYAPLLWKAVARRISEAADVADVVQETMLHAARQARLYEAGRGTLWNWLWGIGRNQVALFYRKRKFTLSLDTDPDALLDWLQNSTVHPPGAASSKELQGVLRYCLSQLPDEEDELLTRRYLNEESVEELACSLNVSEVAVRSRLARARTGLRTIILRHCPSVVEDRR